MTSPRQGIADDLHAFNFSLKRLYDATHIAQHTAQDSAQDSALHASLRPDALRMRLRGTG